MNATLKEGRCDVVIGVPAGYDLVQTTKPYYRSTYVFVYPKGKGLQLKSLDDPVAQEAEDRRAPAWRRLHESAAGSRALASAASSTTWSASTRSTRRRIRRARSSTPSPAEDRRRDRVGAGGRILRRAPAGAAGDGPGPVRQRRPAVRLRYLDGRQEGRRRAARAGGEGARPKQAEIAKILKDYGVPLLDGKGDAK